MIIDNIPNTVIHAVARDVFGNASEVRSIEQLESGVSNFCYKISPKDMPTNYVFRFSKRPNEDTYEYELQHYKLVSQATGVPVPNILRIDRSKQIAPTSYMVYEYLAGEPWEDLCHSDDRRATKEEKPYILQKTGQFFAQVHTITRKKEEVPPDEDSPEFSHNHFFLRDEEHAGREATFLLRRLARIMHKVCSGDLPIPAERIERCRDAMVKEKHWERDAFSLCLSDTEIFFARRQNAWELAFILDIECAHFRIPEFDLWPFLGGADALWDFETPQIDLDPQKIANAPFYAGYRQIAPLDLERFLYLAPYYQLCIFGDIFKPHQPSDWHRLTIKNNLATIEQLVDVIASRA